MKNGFVFIPIIIVVLVFSAIAAITITKFLKNNPLSTGASLTGPTAPTSPTPPATSPSPLPDSDNDGFSNSVENAISTNPNKVCAAATEVNTTYPGSPSNTWPADLHTLNSAFGNGLNKINILDITSFTAPVRRLDAIPGETNFAKRWDLNNDGAITAADIDLVKKVMNKTCSAPK